MLDQRYLLGFINDVKEFHEIIQVFHSLVTLFSKALFQLGCKGIYIRRLTGKPTLDLSSSYQLRDKTSPLDPRRLWAL